MTTYLMAASGAAAALYGAMRGPAVAEKKNDEVSVGYMQQISVATRAVCCPRRKQA